MAEVLNLGDFTPLGTFWQCLDIFGYHNLGGC